jgi:hypothetical protein
VRTGGARATTDEPGSSPGSCSQDNRVPRTGRSGTWHPDARAGGGAAVEQRIPDKTRIPMRFKGIGRDRDTPRSLQFAQGNAGWDSIDGMMRLAELSTGGRNPTAVTGRSKPERTQPSDTMHGCTRRRDCCAWKIRPSVDQTLSPQQGLVLL